MSNIRPKTCNCNCTTHEYSDHALACPFHVAGKSAQITNEKLQRENATVRWTSGAMHTEDQGNGDSCWVLYSEYAEVLSERDAYSAAMIVEEREKNRLSHENATLRNYMQRIIDCPLGNDQIKDYRTLAAARELLAQSALEQLEKRS